MPNTPYAGAGLHSGNHIEGSTAPYAVTGRTEISDGMTAEIVEGRSHDKFAFRFRAPFHLLVFYEQGARHDGETFVEGLPRSKLRDFAGKLTFVPAGHEYCEWQEPRTLARLMYLYFDPAKLQILFNADIGDVSFPAKLFFDHTNMLDTARKLKKALESPVPEGRLYLKALGVVLVHELIRTNRRLPRIEPRHRDGLASWQQRIVGAHIDAHLDEPVSVSTLAELSSLTPLLFNRAFKHSFGVPPHQYLANRRIERAKALLAARARSLMEIGIAVGYSETNSFTAAFRRATGLPPSAYRRELE